MSFIDLDDPQIYQKYDPDGMVTCLEDLPRQCEQAWQQAQDFKIPADYAKVEKVVILGMGGSAIGGDLASSLIAGEAKKPISINRDYNLPAFVDRKTLVITSSYSGNTEETLSAFEQAQAIKAKILVLTTGGKLKELATQNNIPLFTFSYKAQPRAALGYSLLPILACFQKLGFIRNKTSAVAEMVRVLRSLSQKNDDKTPSPVNPAKQLAQKLYGNIPVIYGSGILTEVARRWKTQLNENSKAWAFYEVLPELNHNAVVGYQFPAELTDKIRVVMLRSRLMHPRVLLRYQVTSEILDKAGITYHVVDGQGKSALSQAMSQVLFGDYVSFYLALLYRINPTPVEVIKYLKDRLANG